MKNQRIYHMNTRKVQATKTKMKIFEAAHKLVAEHGIEHVSVNSIVKEAGLSKGAFYVHYKSKDELIVDLVNDYTNSADKGYKTFISSLSDSTESLDILILLVERIADYIEYSIGLENMRALYMAHLTKTIDTTSALNYSRDIYSIFYETLDKAIINKELKGEFSADSLAKHLIMATRGVVFEWCIRHPEFYLKEKLLAHFNLFLDGLKAE